MQIPKNFIGKWFSTALCLLTLDLLWLGSIGRPLYNKAIGHLLAPQANRTAALAFYLFYVTLVCLWATQDNKPAEAARRGAALGFVCYGVYELTNWAVLLNWPAYFVPIDWTWGIFLTATAAWAGAKFGGQEKR